MDSPHIEVDLHGLTWKEASSLVSNTIYAAQVEASSGGPATEKHPVAVAFITVVSNTTLPFSPPHHFTTATQPLHPFNNPPPHIKGDRQAQHSWRACAS
mmetsp:Transcript_68805/g.191986  ORF Transcript_68805/g.191986 Transcript_68805/m.191986 type:complete len:99 (-) Transcript_68805:225-521(-)